MNPERSGHRHNTKNHNTRI